MRGHKAVAVDEVRSAKVGRDTNHPRILAKVFVDRVDVVDALFLHLLLMDALVVCLFEQLSNAIFEGIFFFLAA